MTSRTMLSLLVSLPTCVQASPERSTALSNLLTAIRIVESSGNDKAIGDKGKALGPFQIWAPYWKDGCEYGKVKWKYTRENAFNRRKSRQVVLWYSQRYAPKNPTAETFARNHNGGPLGYKKEATKKYWTKVKRQLKRSKPKR